MEILGIPVGIFNEVALMLWNGHYIGTNAVAELTIVAMTNRELWTHYNAYLTKYNIDLKVDWVGYSLIVKRCNIILWLVKSKIVHVNNALRKVFKKNLSKNMLNFQDMMQAIDLRIINKENAAHAYIKNMSPDNYKTYYDNYCKLSSGNIKLSLVNQFKIMPFTGINFDAIHSDVFSAKHIAKDGHTFDLERELKLIDTPTKYGNIRQLQEYIDIVKLGEFVVPITAMIGINGYTPQVIKILAALANGSYDKLRPLIIYLVGSIGGVPDKFMADLKSEMYKKI